MRLLSHIALPCTMLLLSIAFVACQQTPQQVNRRNLQQPIDSALIAQMQFNTRMAEQADKTCLAIVEADTLQYVMDDFGFWYAKIIRQHADSLQTGEHILLHMQMSELDGSLVADVEEPVVVGSGELPMTINRSIKQMSRGEQMRIIAPWYTAYGTEGTRIIKPYTNLVITLTINNE